MIVAALARALAVAGAIVDMETILNCIDGIAVAFVGGRCTPVLVRDVVVLTIVWFFEMRMFAPEA